MKVALILILKMLVIERLLLVSRHMCEEEGLIESLLLTYSAAIVHLIITQRMAVTRRGLHKCHCHGDIHHGMLLMDCNGDLQGWIMMRMMIVRDHDFLCAWSSYIFMTHHQRKHCYVSCLYVCSYI